MTFNAELARQALADIDADPERWNQAEWRCESGYCYAGFVAFRAGAQWVLPDDQPSSLANACVTGPLVPGVERVSSYAAVALFGRYLSSDEELGLDQVGLFAAENTRERLAKLVDELAADGAA